MPDPQAPWYISAASVRQYAEIIGIDPDGDFDDARDELIDIARVAVPHHVTSTSMVDYRARIPGEVRMVKLLVSCKPRPEGFLHGLVAVHLVERRTDTESETEESPSNQG